MKEIDNAAREYVNPKLALNVNDFGERAQLAYQQFSGYDIMDAFEAGAQWKEEQFEKNRLAACDGQTKEEADIEMNFAMSVYEKEHRQPTFDDAIKYGMRLQKKQMMKDAIDAIVCKNIFNKLSVSSEFIPDNHPSGINFGDEVKIIIIKEAEK